MADLEQHMAGKIAEIRNLIEGDALADSIAELWNEWRRHRQTWVDENLELRDYLYATDTTKTSNRNLPWKNSTTLPKLTQIYDNLLANYKASMFPNDSWLRWEGYTQDDEEQMKRQAIEAYISNKVRESSFITTVTQCLSDYIQWGNAFGEVEFVNEKKEDPETGEIIHGYIGPQLVRISPIDITINPLAVSFKESPKITRKVMTLGELKAEAEDKPDNGYLKGAIARSERVRNAIGGYNVEDFEKAVGYQIDGFGSIYEYFQSQYVEIMTLEGDVHDPETGRLLRNRVISIIDRTYIVQNDEIPSWLGKGSKAHVGWRPRPDNLYAMGPLHNLVGMQYRIDHLENLKADVFDLIAYPPLKIFGEVEQFDWAPGEEIHIDENGDVQMLVPDTTALNADTQIAILEQKMEEFAGAPREAMGIRSPGEKTAFEVQSLQNASSRIFQEKINTFERDFLEPILNSMLEISRRNLDGGDVVRVMDDDLGVVNFLNITKEDITAKGKLRPIGARHFAAQAQLVQNLSGIFNSPMGQLISPHISAKRLANLLEDTLGLARFDLIQDNVAIFEQAETQRLAQSAQEQLITEEQLSASALAEEQPL